MKFVDVPLLVLLLAAAYLCFVYFGLIFAERIVKFRRKSITKMVDPH